MPSDRKSKRVSRVQWQLMLSILLAIVLSWVLSASSAYYMARQNILAIRQQMLARPDLYPHPIPEPRFRLTDFLIGVQPSITTPPQGRAEAQPPPDGMNPPDGQNPPPDGMGAQPQPGGDPNGGPPDTRPPTGAPPRASYAVAVRALVLRSVITLLLALSLGVLLARRFTRPLQALAEGLSRSDLTLQLPVASQDEIGAVATAFNSYNARIRSIFQSLISTSGSVASSHMKSATLAMVVAPGRNRLSTSPSCSAYSVTSPSFSVSGRTATHCAYGSLASMTS